MNKMVYSKPLAEIVQFANEDVIVASCSHGTTSNGGEWDISDDAGDPDQWGF